MQNFLLGRSQTPCLTLHLVCFLKLFCFSASQSLLLLLDLSFVSAVLLCSVAQSCLTLCSPMDCSPPGSSTQGIFQVRILQWSAISYSRGSSWPRNRTWVSCTSCIGRQILYHCTHLRCPLTTLDCSQRLRSDWSICSWSKYKYIRTLTCR